MKKDCSAIVLAAGNSERMGQIKFGLKMRDGRTFLEHIVQKFSEFGCREIVIVVNSNGKSFLEKNNFEFPENIRLVINKHPEYERFHSLKLGLSSLESGRQFIFIHNADNPFVERQVLLSLYENRKETVLVKPSYKGKSGHPILIPDKIRNDIISETENHVRLDDFLHKYSQKKINTDTESILININTKSDYQKL